MKKTKQNADLQTFTKDDEKILAVYFSLVLHSWLSYEELTAINAENEADPIKDQCASHGHCDPNQAMIDAFKDLFNRDMFFDSAAYPQADNDTDLVNAAWNIAKQHRFYLPKSKAMFGSLNKIANIGAGTADYLIEKINSSTFKVTVFDAMDESVDKVEIEYNAYADAVYDRNILVALGYSIIDYATGKLYQDKHWRDFK